jgi:hypothetical protein
MAALVDARLRPPRQGDSDEGRVVLLDAPEHNRWPALLALGGAVFGRLSWWPRLAPDAGSVLASAIAGQARPPVAGRPSLRPSRFADAGISILRTDPSGVAEMTGVAESTGVTESTGVSESTGVAEMTGAEEIWCRCDGGPHGFLSIAAHAHADALSVEVRCDGVDILADPGTYCYHDKPEWRKYFQSTIGHNTAEVGGQWQSARGGAFLWLRQAIGREISVIGLDSGDIAGWTASHDGYRTLKPAASHHRSVRLERGTRTIEITDQVLGGDYDIRLAFHLGPDVQAGLSGALATLTWPGASGEATAELALPGELNWSLHRGEVAPIVGWYSSGLGHRVPSFTFLGQGRCASDIRLITRLRFGKGEKSGGPQASAQAVSLGSSNAALATAQEDQAEAR